MSTQLPIRCLRAARPRRTIIFKLPTRSFSSTSTCSVEEWKRAVTPPKEYITYDMYKALQTRPKEVRNQLAMYTSQTVAESIPPPPSPFSDLDPTMSRLTPASPSYFSAQPNMNDDIVHLSKLLRQSAGLPRIPTRFAPKAVWKPLQAYRLWVGERVAPSRYLRIKAMLQRLNTILPELRTQEVTDALNAHLKDVDRKLGERPPGLLDEWGRGFGQGRRKTAKATAYLVEGTGEVLVNERNITDVFGRVRDRESALWPLTATGRMSRYNVFAVVHGGGTSGWAEATALAVAKALLVHEPGLKTYMRTAGVIRRDPRMVERKKPGHVKARKMPTWVKR